jgi:hypothetical protein
MRHHPDVDAAGVDQIAVLEELVLDADRWLGCHRQSPNSVADCFVML